MYFKPRIFIIYASNLNLIRGNESISELIGSLGADVVTNENNMSLFAYQQGMKNADFILFVADRSNFISSNTKTLSFPKEWIFAMKLDVPKYIYIKDTNFIKLEDSIKGLMGSDDFVNDISIFFYETTIELAEKIKSQIFMIYHSITLNQINAKYLPRENIQKLIYEYDNTLALEIMSGMDELREYESKGDIDFVRTDILSHYLSSFDTLPIVDYEMQYFIQKEWNSRLRYFLQDFKLFKKIQNESFETYGEPKTLKLESIRKIFKYRTLKTNQNIRKAKKHLKDSFTWYEHLKRAILSQ
ncbi:hypothetical protein LEP1GSC125_0306 [Leptospira mayottensis 200901122]|uniref:Uncharacterized protein n=3 Tax=Leptospira mayottensis TaxID=1137606 RepID=A0AA87MNC1_9LEPT|nr:hypothetical protein DQM28_20220 [Leptospira mayottensis]EKR98798.1 hypothetical protein LEP1GSC125_0306 [Leptospira mayottensis 200901122]